MKIFKRSLAVDISALGRLFSAHRLSLVVFAAVVLLALLIAFGRHENSQTRSDYYQPITASELSSGAVELRTGIFVQKIYDFDPESKTFWADGYFWIKWKDPIQAYNTSKTGDGQDGDLNQNSVSNPMSKVEFLNSVEQQQSLKRVTWPETPYQTKDGWSYQSETFSGKFLASEVNLSRFPFETLSLPIEIETDGFWITEVVFRLDDLAGQGVSSNNALQGYTFEGTDIKVRKHIYNTSFGLTVDAIDGFGHPHKSVYPNFVANFVYSRSPRSTAWQLFIPLVAVLTVTIVSPLIDSRNIEPKVGLPASVILALVFLQQGYREMLPKSISYLTFMDKVYGVAYSAAVAVFVYAVISTNVYLRGRGQPGLSHRLAALKRFESRFNSALIFLVLVVPVLLWFAG